MAYTSRGWLQGDTVRPGRYKPIKAELKVPDSLTEWQEGHRVAFCINAYRENGDFFKLMLQQREVDDLFYHLANAVSDDMKNRVINQTLGIDDSSRGD